MFELTQGSILFKEELIKEDELMVRVNAVSTYCKQYLMKPYVIGLALPRTPDLLIAILAALKLKIPFVPIDISQPSARLEYIISEANITTILTSHAVSLSFKFNNLVYMDDINYLTEFNSEFIDLDSTVAYILYTSGSTGRPKGVEVMREGLENFIAGVSDIIDFSPGKRIACFTTVCFDIFLLESIMSLCKRLTVVLSDEETRQNPKLMAKFIKDNGVEMIQMTPSGMQLLLNHDQELSCLKNVKEIMIGGEAFPLSLLRLLQEKTTAKIYNMYGPTETTIWSTISELTNKDCIDIGRPIKNTQIYIVDEQLNLKPDGAVGEICIAGKGVAKGYVNDEKLTADKFIHLPQLLHSHVYRTGDLGKYLPDGNLEYLGRIDNQIKVRGYRIEPEEIEMHLNQFDGIKQSVVIAVGISDTDKILSAFYTSDSELDFNKIKEFLSLKLPQYMIPVKFNRVKEFFYTANGKIDRNKVQECAGIEPNKVLPSAKLTDIQKQIFDVILSSLSKKIEDNISMDMTFSDIGLDSITFIKIIIALEENFDIEFDDEMLLMAKFPAIKTMIEYVESKALSSC